MTLSAKPDKQPFNLLSYLSFYGTPDTPAAKPRKVRTANPAAATPARAAATALEQKP